MEWTGVPLAALLAEAGATRRVEVVFTGLDRGVEGGVEQDYARSLSLADCRRRAARLRLQRRAAAAAARLPAAPDRARLVRDDEREVAARGSPSQDEPFEGYQMVTGYRMQARRGRSRHAGHADRAALADDPAGHPGLHDAAPVPAARAGAPRGPRMVGLGRRSSASRSASTAARPGAMRELGDPPGPAAWAPWWFEWDAPAGEHVLCARAHDASGRSQPDDAAVERRRLRQQRDPAHPRHRPLSGTPQTACARSSSWPIRATSRSRAHRTGTQRAGAAI